jgi:Tol biopolymer transport system component
MQADLQALQNRLERRALSRKVRAVTVGIIMLLALVASVSMRVPRLRELILGKSFSSIRHVLPPSRSFVLPPEGTTFNLIGDNGGSVALSADGTKLAFVAVNAKGAALIWVRPLAKLTAEALDGTEGATFPFWSPEGRSLGFFADGKLKKIGLDGGSAVALCDAPFGRGGSWNSRGLIIFAPTSHSGIYRVADSGGVPTPITKVDTSLHTTHRWPRFLPDGNHFIYLATSHYANASHDGVYFSSLDGTESRLVVPTDADVSYASGYLFFRRKNVFMAQPFEPERGQLLSEPRPTVERVLYDPSIWKAVFDVSDNGVMAYQLGDTVSGTQLRWFDRSGAQLGLVGEPRLQFVPRLTPNGWRLAVGVASGGTYGGYSHLWVYDLASGVDTKITFSKYDNGWPIWSPDGARVLFAGKRQHYSIYQVAASGTESEKLILDTGSDTWPLDLSHDGRFLLYGQGYGIEHARSRLWIYPMDGDSAPFRLLEGDSVEADGQFSPDGRWVTYTSNESGRLEAYVVPFYATSNLGQARNAALGRKWQISILGGRWPRWRRDGRELFYLALDNTLMLVPVLSHGSVFRIGTPHPLFRINPGNNYDTSYDVSPDGSRFIINTAPKERTAPITLVENWLSDFNK